MRKVIADKNSTLMNRTHAKQARKIWRKNFQALPSNHILRVESFLSRTLYRLCIVLRVTDCIAWHEGIGVWQSNTGFRWLPIIDKIMRTIWQLSAHLLLMAECCCDGKISEAPRGAIDICNSAFAQRSLHVCCDEVDIIDLLSLPCCQLVVNWL